MMYSHAALSTGARPVPVADATTGARVMDGWKFNYLSWKMDLGSTVNH
jgi:hypothetical protein